MDRRGVFHRDVQDTGLEIGWDQVDESVLHPLEAGHALPSLSIVFPSIV